MEKPNVSLVLSACARLCPSTVALWPVRSDAIAMRNVALLGENVLSFFIIRWPSAVPIPSSAANAHTCCVSVSLHL